MPSTTALEVKALRARAGNRRRWSSDLVLEREACPTTKDTLTLKPNTRTYTNTHKNTHKTHTQTSSECACAGPPGGADGSATYFMDCACD